jgi:hypothetical protein
MTPVCLRQLLLSRRSPTLWHRTVPIHTVYFFFYCPRSLAGAFYLYHRQRDAPGIFYLSLDPRPGTTAPTAPIIGILEIVGRYHNRYNFRPRVVIPLHQQGSRHRHASSLFLYVYYDFSTSLSPRQLPSNDYCTRTRSPLLAGSEPAIGKVILYCLAHHYLVRITRTVLCDGVSIRLLVRLVYGYMLIFVSIHPCLTSHPPSRWAGIRQYGVATLRANHRYSTLGAKVLT